jgi:Domain of unknown function (DUF4112)
MSRVREIEVEVVGKDEPRSGLRGDDPMIALVARLMDTVFTIPGTKLRFGLDPLLGLLPGFGDTATAIVSALLIAQSARHGVPRIVLARMAGNVLLNTALGSVPLVGDAFSFWFKSNVRNYDLLRRHAGTRRRAGWRDWTFVFGLLAAIVALTVFIIVGAVTLLGKLFS